MTDLKVRPLWSPARRAGSAGYGLALAARGAHVLVVGRNEQRAKDVVAEIEGSGGSATFRLTTLSDLESARDLVEWATEARRSRRHPHQQRRRRLARAKQRRHRSRVRRDLRAERQGPVLPRRVLRRPWPNADGVRSSTSPRWSRASDRRHGSVRRQPGGSRTADQGLGRRIRPRGVRVNAVAPGPTRTRDDGSSPRGDGEQLAALAPAGRELGPRNLPQRSSSSPVMMPALFTASLLRSTGAGSRRNSPRRRRSIAKI